MNDKEAYLNFKNNPYIKRIKSIKQIALLYYDKFELNIIPFCYSDNPQTKEERNLRKKPAVPWTPLKSKRLTREELIREFSCQRNIGVMLGECSGFLICLDFDVNGMYEKWANSYPHIANNTATVSTGREGGYHVYFRMRGVKQRRIANAYFQGDKIGEVRGEESLNLLPPSTHPEGRIYKWYKPITGGIYEIHSLDEIGIYKGESDIKVKKGVKKTYERLRTRCTSQ